MNDVNIFNLETMEWKYFRTEGVVESCRYHAAGIIGKHMIVHGGLNAQSNVLCDFFSLNMDTAEWNPIQL